VLEIWDFMILQGLLVQMVRICLGITLNLRVYLDFADHFFYVDSLKISRK
jgi:hypothetical protein